MGSYLVDAEQGAFLVLLRMTVQHPAHTLYEIYWGNVEEYALATGGKVEELARFVAQARSLLRISDIISARTDFFIYLSEVE